MSRDKQIEEMAKAVCYLDRTCDECMTSFECKAMMYAKRFYNAGYRKQSENVIELPCKVGTTLYFLYNSPYADKPDLTPHIYKTTDWYFEIDKTGIVINTSDIHSFNKKYDYFLGETVFLTKEEAEKAIAKLKKETHGERKMTLEEAKKLLDEEYERAKMLKYVINPLAYALYQVWKKADTDNAHRKTDLTDKCGSCEWAMPIKGSIKGVFGCYIKCQNPNKVWRHEISKKRQRTTPKCRYYERNENGT